MSRTGISNIDDLFEGRSLKPITPNEPDPATVSIVQELLIGHGFKGVPDIWSPARGHFDSSTSSAVSAFQKACRLPESGIVDRLSLQMLVMVPAREPVASHGYLALLLDFDYTGMTRLMSLTSQLQGHGRFSQVDLNTRGMGLSFGLLQWAQASRQLYKLLRRFQQEQPQVCEELFGAYDCARVQALMDHTARRRGSTNRKGQTTDPQYDLIAEPWTRRFIAAGRNEELQRVQVIAALDDFLAGYSWLQSFAPQIRSERTIAFMIDLACYHGQKRAKCIFANVQTPNLSEGELLACLQKESIAFVRRKFGDGNEMRSRQATLEALRTSPLLGDKDFKPAEESGKAGSM